MAANTSPIFILTPNMQWAKLDYAPPSGSSHIASGSLGTEVKVVYSASLNGSRIDELRILSLGTNPATVVRLFVNNGSDNNTIINNSLFDEITIAGTSMTEAVANVVNDIVYTNGLNLAPSHRLLAVTSVSQSDGLHITAFGGDY